MHQMTRVIEFSTFLKGKYLDVDYEPEYTIEAEVQYVSDDMNRWHVRNTNILALWHEVTHVEDHKSREYLSFGKIEIQDQSTLRQLAEEHAKF